MLGTADVFTIPLFDLCRTLRQWYNKEDLTGDLYNYNRTTRGCVMATEKVPSKHYQKLLKTFPDVLAAVENLGTTVKDAGPIDKKTSELIQLAVAAASQSTGSVQSHTRRANRSFLIRLMCSPGG